MNSRRLKQITAILAAATMVFGSAPIVAFADETTGYVTATVEADDASASVDTDADSSSADAYDPSQDQVLNEYASYIFGTGRKYRAAKNANWNLNKLTGTERAVYDYYLDSLRDLIQNGGDTEIRFVFADHDCAAPKTVQEAYDIKEKVIDYAYKNHPELTCWRSRSERGVNETGAVSTDYISIRYKVDRNYRGKNVYDLDNTRLEAVRKAKATADKIIEDDKSLDDFSKIKAYADWIAAHNTYNDAAANNDSLINTDSQPWSLTYVFDEDSNTNVVCEGYAKAFQYLMDNTDFSDKDIVSKIVTSDTHMWNVVTIDNVNYLMDVTWYDSDDADQPNDSDYLLGGQATLDLELNAGTEDHIYEDDTTDFYSEDELTLSYLPYLPPQDGKEALHVSDVDISIPYRCTYYDFETHFTSVKDAQGKTVDGTWYLADASKADEVIPDDGGDISLIFVPEDREKYQAYNLKTTFDVSQRILDIDIDDQVFNDNDLDSIDTADFTYTIEDEDYSGLGLADGDTADDVGITFKIFSPDSSEEVSISDLVTGEYTIRAFCTNKWYTTDSEGTLTITGRAVPQITVDPIDITYGDVVTQDSITASATYDGEEVPGKFTYSDLPDDHYNAGNYVIHVKFTPDDTETYSTINHISIPVKVEQMQVLIAINDATRLVGEENPDFDYSYAMGKIASWDDPTDVFTIECDADEESAPGSYKITGHLNDGYEDNYYMTFVPGTLQVKAQNQVTIDKAPTYIMTYGSQTGTLSDGRAVDENGNQVNGTFRLTSLDLNGTSNSTRSNSALSVGDHTGLAIAEFDPADDDTYEAVTGIPVTVRIQKRFIAVTIDDKTWDLSNAKPEFTYHITSGTMVGNDRLSDMITLTSEAGTSSRPGTYAITGTVNADKASNYDISITPGALTVNSGKSEASGSQTVTPPSPVVPVPQTTPSAPDVPSIPAPGEPETPVTPAKPDNSGTTDTDNSATKTAKPVNHPTTASIKNNKTYKTTKKITVKDTDGIVTIQLKGKKTKTIRLNGRKSYSFQLSKYKKYLNSKGKSNKLIIKDRNGKKKTIKFKIK